VLQMMRFVAAANCSEMQPAVTSLYADLYAHLPPLLTTDHVQASSNSPLGQPSQTVMRVGTDSASRPCSVRSLPIRRTIVVRAMERVSLLEENDEREGHVDAA